MYKVTILSVVCSLLFIYGVESASLHSVREKRSMAAFCIPQLLSNLERSHDLLEQLNTYYVKQYFCEGQWETADMKTRDLNCAHFAVRHDSRRGSLITISSTLLHAQGNIS
ncbi:hypothetical protein EB796_019007 [Bugula neritina]|uniref:Uncharacterized protein n=1 Tax=Bugula neritina TaxID=10212 RepID=A0A7J7J8Y5_BUGNE|nr:hypothetical protein EB796_019007 [Bugula neritina]